MTLRLFGMFAAVACFAAVLTGGSAHADVLSSGSKPSGPDIGVSAPRTPPTDEYQSVSSEWDCSGAKCVWVQTDPYGSGDRSEGDGVRFVLCPAGHPYPSRGWGSDNPIFEDHTPFGMGAVVVSPLARQKHYYYDGVFSKHWTSYYGTSDADRGYVALNLVPLLTTRTRYSGRFICQSQPVS